MIKCVKSFKQEIFYYVWISLVIESMRIFFIKSLFIRFINKSLEYTYSMWQAPDVEFVFLIALTRS